VALAVSREGKKVNLTAKIGKREGPVLLRSDGWQSGPKEREFQFGPDGRTFRFQVPNGNGPFAFSLPPGGGDVFESRPLLGVTLQPLTEQLAEFLGVMGKRGALVTSVSEGSPAAAAKLRAGDVVVRAGDRAVEDPQDLARAVGRAAGERLELKVVRDKREITVTVELPKESRNTRGFRL
jgi:membrane-associated protease RseP (regulator of RpoE activity)